MSKPGNGFLELFSHLEVGVDFKTSVRIYEDLLREAVNIKVKEYYNPDSPDESTDTAICSVQMEAWTKFINDEYNRLMSIPK